MSSFVYRTELPNRTQRISNLKFIRRLLEQAEVEALAQLTDVQGKLAIINQQLKELGYEEAE